MCDTFPRIQSGNIKEQNIMENSKEKNNIQGGEGKSAFLTQNKKEIQDAYYKILRKQKKFLNETRKKIKKSGQLYDVESNIHFKYSHENNSYYFHWIVVVKKYSRHILFPALILLIYYFFN